MNRNFELVTSNWDFYLTEIIFAIIFAAFCFLYLKTPQNVPSFIIMVAVIFICFLIEHKYHVIFDRRANSVQVLTKALFRNKYRISAQHPLDNIGGVRLTSHNNGKSTSYLLEFYDKRGSIIPMLPRHSSSNFTRWYTLQQKIEQYLNSNQNHFEIEESPFMFRLFSVVFLVIFANVYGNFFGQIFQLFTGS